MPYSDKRTMKIIPPNPPLVKGGRRDYQVSRHVFTRLLLLLLVLSLILSCSSEKQQGTHAPSPTPAKGTTVTSKLEIQPFEATRETTFFINAKAIDVSKAKVQWYVNGKIVQGAIANQFRPSEIKKGDSVQVKVLIGEQEIASNQITIKNIPPAIVRAKIVPETPKSNDILKVDAIGNDRDKDAVSFLYEWSKNEKSAGSGASLQGPFKRDDKISVKITPYDGTDYGQPITLATHIYNSPPNALRDGIEKFENNIYSYQVKATDPDGDTLTYDLKKAPAGMVIDKTSGLITWKITEKESGKYPVTIEISDGHGGRVLYNFDVTVRLK
ncbi:MAG: hypothetical protein FJ241_05865 [Nitrospira sp.]|nr:hypothetical protein [Nitrospira sp.]